MVEMSGEEWNGEEIGGASRGVKCLIGRPSMLGAMCEG